MFSSPEAALRSAFGSLARPHYASASLWRDVAGGSVRGPVSMSAFDRVAQAGITLQRARLTLRPQQWLMVQARYRVVGNDLTRAEKERDARLLALEVAHRRDVSLDTFMQDVTREWCGLRPDAGVREWSRRLGRHKSTMHRWRYGSMRSRRPGVITILDEWHTATIAELHASFQQAGIC